MTTELTDLATPCGADPPGLLRIGEAAERAGVSERTLRYYEQIGLLSPAAHSPGGNRRYGAAELERVRQIRDLVEVMGLNLDEVRRLLRTEDHLAELRARWHHTTSLDAKRAILEEARRVNGALRDRVAAQLARAATVLAQIDERIARVEAMRAELAAPGDAAAD